MGKGKKAAAPSSAEGGIRTRSGKTVTRPDAAAAAPAAVPQEEEEEEEAEQQQTAAWAVESPSAAGRIRKPVLREKKTKQKKFIKPQQIQAQVGDEPAAEAAEPEAGPSGTARTAAAAEAPAGAEEQPAAADHEAAAAAAAGVPAPAAAGAASPAAPGVRGSMAPPPPHAGVGTSSPAQQQQQQRRTGQHTTSPVSGMVPIVLVPMVPPATVRMGGAEFPAGQARGVPRQHAAAAAGRSPGQQARMSVSWCHPATASLPEREGGVNRPPARAAAAPRPRVTVSWCQPAGEAAPPAHR